MSEDTAKRESRLRKMRLRWWPLLKDTVAGWWEDKAPRLGAALAFYTVLSLAPLLVIVTPLAGRVFGDPERAKEEITAQFEQLIGSRGAEAIDLMMTPAVNPEEEKSGTFTTVLSVAVLLFGASGVFAELQESLNTIWEVAPKPGASAVFDFFRQRFLSFAMVMGICFLLLVSLVVSAALEAMQAYADRHVASMAAVWQVANVVVSFAVITLLFAMIFKVLPDATVGWKDVWIGAAITSALFALGRTLIGVYLGQASIGARYGAAGSLVALLVWVYYSSQILLMGAEFTKVYSRRTGSRVVATSIAVPVTAEARAQQGIAHKEVVEAVAEVVERKEIAKEIEEAKAAGEPVPEEKPAAG